MSKKPIIALILLAAIMALVACGDNLFGTGSSEGDVKAMRIDAENAFRRGDYKGAYKICSKIVAKDSTSSFGYYGMAKATMWEKNINIADMMVLIKLEEEEKEEGKLPFAKENAYTQNRYLQGMRPVYQALTPLDRRDSLTNLYELHQNALKGIGLDSIFTITKRDTSKLDGKISTYTIEMDLEERLRDFRRMYCNNAARKCYDTDKGKTPFPLSDREYKGDYFGPILLFSTTIKIFMELLDINKDNCITKRGNDTLDNPGMKQSDAHKWADWGCNSSFHYDIPIDLTKNEDGTFSVDISKLNDELGIDDKFFEDQLLNRDIALPPSVIDLNNSLSEFTGNMDEVIKIMEAFGMGDGIAEDGEDWKDNVNQYKGQVAFYKTGTRIDEDGDGCIEEELLNGQDGDGDGLESENARIAIIDPDSPLWGKSGINHSMYGDDPESYANVNHPRNWPRRIRITDKPTICNNPECTLTAELIPDEHGYVTVMGFTQEPGYWTVNDADLKLEVVKDTVCPPKLSLKWRQENIGGCWRYYNNYKFVKYWLKRGMARKEDQELRTHSSCKKCEGDKCLE
jgi:hypothetical protein